MGVIIASGKAGMLVRYGRVVMSPSWSTEVFKRRLRHVRYHPNRGAKADIPALHIWANSRSRPTLFNHCVGADFSSDNRRIMLTLETASSIGTAKAFANRQLYFALEYLNSPAGTVRT